MRLQVRLTASAVVLALAVPTAAAPVVLPGVQYEVLASGAKDGPRPTRADAVAMRYIGRLQTGEVFSTSGNGGAEPTEFKVRDVIPGMSAALQLMRPGDRWRIRLAPYLAYGWQGRRYQPPEPTLKRDVPPDATLVFDVELVRIIPAAAAAR